MSDMLSYEKAFADIPPRQCAIFMPLIRQFQARPVPVRFGYLARVDNGKAQGWCWAGSIDDERLLTFLLLKVDRPFTLHEEPTVSYESISLLSESDAATVDRLIETFSVQDALRSVMDDRARGSFPSQKERVSLLSVRPGSYDYRYEPGRVYFGAHLIFLPGYIERLEREHPEEYRGLARAFEQMLDCSDDRCLRTVLHDVMPAAVNLPGARLRYAGVADQALGELISYLSIRNPASERQSLDVVRQAKAYLLDNMDDPPNTNQLALMLNISVGSLCLAFKRAEGMTIGTWFAARRLERAKELLANSAMSLDGIAQQVGYRHQSTFSTAFRRETGMPPSAWRKAHIEAAPYGGATVRERARQEATMRAAQTSSSSSARRISLSISS